MVVLSCALALIGSIVWMVPRASAAPATSGYLTTSGSTLRTADGRPYSAMLLGAALSDDTVLALAAQILDEPRASRRADPALSISPLAVEEHM